MYPSLPISFFSLLSLPRSLITFTWQYEVAVLFTFTQQYLCVCVNALHHIVRTIFSSCSPIFIHTVTDNWFAAPIKCYYDCFFFFFACIYFHWSIHSPRVYSITSYHWHCESDSLIWWFYCSRSCWSLFFVTCNNSETKFSPTTCQVTFFLSLCKASNHHHCHHSSH